MILWLLWSRSYFTDYNKGFIIISFIYLKWVIATVNPQIRIERLQATRVSVGQIGQRQDARRVVGVAIAGLDEDQSQDDKEQRQTKLRDEQLLVSQGAEESLLEDGMELK